MSCNKSYIYYLLVFLCLAACKKDNTFEIKNLNDGKILIIGHAGSGLTSSDNPIKEDTFISIKNAVELYGAHGVEMDIHMSSDSIFYLLHDQVLDVSTNFQGCVYDYTSEQLEECYLNYSNEKLTQLEKVLSHFSSYNQKPIVFFDTRLYAPCNVENYISFIKQFANNIYNIVDKYNAYEYVQIESRDPLFLQLIQSKSNQFNLFIDGFVSSELDIAVNMNLKGIVVEDKYISKEEVELAHSKNVMVVTYGALNKKQTIEAIKKSPDMIQTDNILLLKQLLNQ